MKQTIPYLALSLFLIACQPAEKSAKPIPKAEQLIRDMVTAIGGEDALKKLKDVEYTYTYESFDGFSDVSTERYIFEGELSWAEYQEHKNAVFPNQEGLVVQGYDGKSSWVTFNGDPVEEEAPLRMADFLRKTNFYWFAMQFKLLDPGLNYSYEGSREVEGLTYEIVKVSFNENVGDVQDDYLLYINPETHLIDQFLFTVRDFGREAPLMMRVEYEEIEGVKLTTYREYALANWVGEIDAAEGWTKEISTNIKFNNGFRPENFSKPQ